MKSQHLKLEPASVWSLFNTICSIPHPSGHETKLALKLASLAKDNGLFAKIDAAGNLRIDRPASPGYENAPKILLQAHLDMVPQALTNIDFDFNLMPIPMTVEDGWVKSAAGTTLGGDDGIGVAAAMSLLLDKQIKCGALSGVFTVSEEVGLKGAYALSEEFLKGDFLLNLDSEEEGQLYIGCAGGARLGIDIELPLTATPSNYIGLSCEIKNLPGGHSGVNIHQRRGNAIVFLARLMKKMPEFEISALSGGTFDNVIPSNAIALGAVKLQQLTKLQSCTAEAAVEFTREIDSAMDCAVELQPTSLPERVWERKFRDKMIELLASCPNGVCSSDNLFNIPSTSSNLAALKTEGALLKINTSQRGLVEAERKKLTSEIASHFASVNGRAKEDNSYPGWKPDLQSELLYTAKLLYQELFAIPPQVKIIHAGLECGVLAKINPALKMISFGPTILHAHSPLEKLNINSVERFYKFLKLLIIRLQKPSNPSK